MKVVFDTNIFISFLLTSSPTISKIFAAWDYQFSLCYCGELLAEVRRALAYPKLQRYLVATDKKILLEKIQVTGLLIEVNSQRQVCRDPADDLLINLALEARANYLVTGDQDLLDLNEVEGVKILTPKKFVSLLTN